MLNVNMFLYNFHVFTGMMEIEDGSAIVFAMLLCWIALTTAGLILIFKNLEKY